MSPQGAAAYVQRLLTYERRLLGRLLLSTDLALEAAATLRPDDWYDRRHRTLYRAIAELAQRGRVTPLAVAEHPAVREAGIAIGDLTEFLDDPAIPPEVEPLIGYLREQATRRRVQERVDALSRLLQEDHDADALRAAVTEQATAILSEFTEASAPVVTIGDALTGLVTSYSSPERRRRTTIGLPMTLGHHLGGLKAGDLVVLMARPSMGKTAMALQWASSAITMGGAKAVFVASLEMTAESLADRLLQQQTGTSLQASGADSEAMREQLLSSIDPTLVQVGAWPLYVSERRGLRAGDIAVLARRVAFEHGRLDLVVVDYLQLIRLTGSRSQNQASAIGDVCRELRDLGGDLNCPVVLLSQLNRGVEARDNKRPVLSDLRDSGNIEEAADIVISLYREEYYRRGLPQGDPRRGKAEVAILKFRSGPAPRVHVLGWHPERQWFDELEPSEEAAYKAAVKGEAG